jgi:hypothetical protein
MFDPKSRYAKLDDATLVVREPGGDTRTLTYKRRRFFEATPAGPLAEHTLAAGDRLDRLSAAKLGDPLRFWQICDANLVLRPDDLTAEPGRLIEIPGLGA